MSRPHVHISIQLGMYPSINDKSIVMPIDEFVIRKASESLDYASPDAPVAIRMFITTPPQTIRETELRRRDLAEAVARHVKAKVLEMLGANDTEMGYKRESASAGEGHASR